MLKVQTPLNQYKLTMHVLKLFWEIAIWFCYLSGSVKRKLWKVIFQMLPPSNNQNSCQRDLIPFCTFLLLVWQYYCQSLRFPLLLCRIQVIWTLSGTVWKCRAWWILCGLSRWDLNCAWSGLGERLLPTFWATTLRHKVTSATMR